MRKLNVLVYDSIALNLVNFLKENYDVSIFKISKDMLPDKVDLILFNGEQKGHINPDMYSELNGKFTNVAESYWGKYSSLTDYAYRNIPCLGIDDGAHYLTVQAGGSLVQYVQGHDKDHYLSSNTVSSMIAPSNHTQMMYPFELPESKFKVLGWSTYFTSPTYLNGKNEERELDKAFLEPEVVYYNNKKSRSLCIQGDPVKGSKQYRKYCHNLIEQLLEEKL